MLTILLIAFSAHAGGKPAVRLGELTVVLEENSEQLIVAIPGSSTRALSLEAGTMLWSRQHAQPLWLRGTELLILDQIHREDPVVTVADARNGNASRTCAVPVPDHVRSFPDNWAYGWSATAEGLPDGRVWVSWQVQASYSPTAAESRAAQAEGAALVVPAMSSYGAFAIDSSTCSISTRGRPEAPSAPPSPSVQPSAEISDVEGRRFPAFRWVGLAQTDGGPSVKLLDAGYRTRVVHSADNTSFATVYTEPSPTRATVWSIYDLASGDRLARLVPADGAGYTFVTLEGSAYFVTAPELGLVAYDMASGAERWRTTLAQ